jgi:hypothetical protein
MARQFTGDFETHLTLRTAPGDSADEPLRLWAARHGMKYTRIVLDRGRTPDQPMLTAVGRGTLAEQRAAAVRHVGRLRGGGFDVVRVKIEAAPWNEDVPRTAGEAESLPEDCYFEHHVKLVLAGEHETAAVRELSERHGAHVSRNARRVLNGGSHERFVTQRCRRVGRQSARDRLEALLKALADGGFSPVEVEEEFVVHDDNPSVDVGWIEEREGGVR